MSIESSEQQKPFYVIAHLDQLEKVDLDKKYDWQKEPKSMRVCAYFKNVEEVKKIFTTLWRNQFVVFTNAPL